MNMPRIEDSMNAAEIFLAITEADVAVSDMMDELVQIYKVIEPKVKTAAYYLRIFDSLGLYGSDIAHFYHIKCDSRIEVMLAVLRFYQEGRLTKASVIEISPDGSRQVLRRMAEMDRNYLPFYQTKKHLA